MQLIYENFGPAVVGDLHVTIEALNIPGFAGVSHSTKDGGILRVDFIEGTTITADQHNGVDAVVAAYVPPDAD